MRNGSFYLRYRRGRALAARALHESFGRALVLGARLAPRLRRRSPDLPRAPVRILALALQRIGDAVTTEPSLRILREKFPAARLEVAASAESDPGPDMGACEVFRLVPQVDFVHPVRRARDLGALSGKNDLVVVFGLRARDAWSALLARGERGVALGYSWRGRGHALDRALEPPDQVMLTASEAFSRGARPQHEFWGDLLARAGLCTQEDVRRAGPPRLRVGERERADVRALLRERGLEPPLLALAPWNAQAHFRWPEERWAPLARSLVEAGLARSVAVVGGRTADEVAHASRIVAEIGERATSFAGAFGLDRWAALLAEAALVVAVDSGPAHVARAVYAPTLALFGPGSPAVWAPPGARVLQRADLCHGCREPRCFQERRECLDDLSLSSVVAAARETLAPPR
ncbi:glycosyltransferase family 9 protein [bacterium]|nr:glycosyltransferase family 9 protein [bacterium]